MLGEILFTDPKKKKEKKSQPKQNRSIKAI